MPGGKMIWDSPGAYSAELARMRKRVNELEGELVRQQGEYRASIELVTEAYDDLAGRHDDLADAVKGLRTSLDNHILRERK